MAGRTLEASRVLVTAIGTAAATAVVSELSKSGEFVIVGTDIYQSFEVPTSKDVDKFFIAPSAVDNKDEYLDFILGLCEREDIDYYFAIIDEEVVNVVRNRTAFEEIGVKLCLPNSRLVELCHNKREFSRWVKSRFPSNYIRCIESQEDALGATYPLFAKPVCGRASMGVFQVSSYVDYEDKLHSGLLGEGVLLQEYVNGEIVAVDMARSAATGQFKAIPRLETQRNGNGCGVAVTTFYDSALIDLCRNIAVQLNLNGVVNVEFFRTPDGYKIIEVNPRLSAGTAYSCLSGADLVLDAIRIARGEPLSVGELRHNVRFAKRYEVYEMGEEIG